MTLAGFHGDGDIHIMLNMYWESLDFELPSVPGRIWLKAVDTSQTPPFDVVDLGCEIPIAGNTCRVQERSVVVLVNHNR